MADTFDLNDIRELIVQFAPEASQIRSSNHNSLVSTIRGRHLLSSAWVKKEFRRTCEDANERVSLETLSPKFDVSPSLCMEILKSEIDQCLLSSDRKSIIPEKEQNSILDELKTISSRIGVSIRQFALGNDINFSQMPNLIDRLNSTQDSNDAVYLELLVDGDSLISKGSRGKYLTSIGKLMDAAQDQATHAELEVRSDFQDLSLPRTLVLLFATEILTQRTAISGWIQDRGQGPVLFTPNSSIVQALRTGELQYVSISEPVRKPNGRQELLEKSRVLLREQISKAVVAYINDDANAVSITWMQNQANHLDSRLSELGVARLQFTELPNQLRSTAASLLTKPDLNEIRGTSNEGLLQTPCTRIGNLLISEKWRYDIETRLEQTALDSAKKQVDRAIEIPVFDVADALEDLLKGEKSLASVDRSESKHALLNRNLNHRVKSAFDGELDKEYALIRERFCQLYCDRILFRADLAHEFNQSIKEHLDLAKILEGTLESWIQETLIPQNLKARSPLLKLAQQCNDKALVQKLDALKTQWRGFEDLKSFPPQYHIIEIVDNEGVRKRAKEGLIRKQQDYLAKETKPLDSLLELLVILLARRTPGFPHARGKHIPRLITFLQDFHSADASGTQMADLLDTLDQLKQKVKAGSAADSDINEMRDIERRDAKIVFPI